MGSEEAGRPAYRGLRETIIIHFKPPYLCVQSVVMSHVIRGALFVKPIVLTNGILIDGAGREPLVDATVVIRGEEIVAVGPGPEVALPQEPYDKYDLSSQYLLPGLIDCHVHITIGGGPSGTFEYDDLYTVLTTLKYAQRTVEAGITTIRDLGGRNFLEFTVRRAIEEGLFPGPRMVLAGKIVSMTSTGADYWPGMYREADGPDEVRKAAREQLKAGAGLVKLMATGSAMAPGEQPAPQYSSEEMRAAVEEAHKVGKPVAAHASGIVGIRNALEAGVDAIEHGSHLHEDPKAIELMANRRVFLIPTRKAFTTVVEHGSNAGIPKWMIEQVKEESEHNEESLRAAVAAGVPIAMGTDAGGPLNYHGENAEEMVLLVEAGLSPVDAIVAATKRAAQCIGLADRVGTIEVGKWADLLVVQENPLKEIGVLTRGDMISLVIKDGKPVVR